MATTDSDHLPFRTVTGADSFDSWRRITNSIGRDSIAGAVESGHLYLDNFDWTARLVNPRGPEPLGGGHVIQDFANEITASELATIEAQTVSDAGSVGNFNMAINGAADQSGVTLNPNSQQAYFDFANGGVRITGASSQWIRIKTRIPIDTNAQYRIKARVKNLSPSGNNVENRIYFGHIGLNNAFLALETDAQKTYNWSVAGNEILDSNSTGDQITEFTEVIGPGFNPLYVSNSTVRSAKKFDPGSKYFDLVFINYYTGGDNWSTGNDIVIQGIEVERLPAGIVITEHDDVDNVPQAKLQVGFQEEFAVDKYSNDGSTLFVNGDIQLANTGVSPNPGADGTGRAIIFNDSNTGLALDHIFSSNGPVNASGHTTGNDFHIVTTGRFRTGRAVGEKILYRGRDYNIAGESSATHYNNSTIGTGLNGDRFSTVNRYSAIAWDGVGNGSNTFYPIAAGEDTHNSSVNVGTIKAQSTTTAINTDVLNTMRAPLMIGRDLNHDGSEDGKIVPLLHLGVGSFRSRKSGGGPAINFHLPDLTGDHEMYKEGMSLAYTHKVAQIACVKQSAFAAEDSNDSRDFLSNDERGPVGALVFRVGSNSMANGTNGQGDQLVEAMRISSSNTATVTKPTKIYMGMNTSNRPADLHVTGDIANIKGLDYTWPSNRTGAAATGDTRVLASDSSGNLAWKTISTVSVTQSVTTQSVTAPLGTIMAWAGYASTIPNNFVECKGQRIGSISSSIIDNAEKTALLAVIGNKYGGSNTINSSSGAKLPDLRTRIPVGRSGSNPFAVGEVFGTSMVTTVSKTSAGTVTGTTANHQLTAAQIPDHKHFIASTGSEGTGDLTASNQLEKDYSYREDGSRDTSQPNFEYKLHGTTSGANVGRTSGIIGNDSGSHSHSISNQPVNIGSLSGDTNSNYAPSVAITYIIKVKEDVVKGLDVSLGSFLDSTTTSDHTGTKTDVLTFDSKSLRLSDGHPTWNTTRLNSHGYDFYLNTKSDGTRATSARANGLAMAAISDRLDINYLGQIADKTQISTSGITKFTVQGNMGDGGSDHIISTAKYTTFDNLTAYTSPVSSSLPHRTMTVNHENRKVVLNNTRVSDITSDQDVIIKGYLSSASNIEYRPGEIVQQFYHRVGAVKAYEINGTSGKYNTSTLKTPGQSGFRVCDLQGLNFIQGSESRSLFGINLEDFEISITPRFADSLIVVEYNICGEPASHNHGIMMGEVNSAGAAQIITRSGYEGYQANAPLQYSNYYFSDFYDGDNNSTLSQMVITYIDKPNTTGQKTYVPIFHSIHGGASTRRFYQNRTVTTSTNYQYEYGVSSMSIKEIRQ